MAPAWHAVNEDRRELLWQGKAVPLKKKYLLKKSPWIGRSLFSTAVQAEDKEKILGIVFA